MNTKKTKRDFAEKTQRDLAGLKIELSRAKVPQSPNAWKAEGYDHINISPRAKTDIGLFLDFDHVSKFQHPQLGRFRSINGLWHFVAARQPDDVFRDLYGGALRSYRTKNKIKTREIPNLRAIIMHSAYLKIKASPQQTRALKESTLPFDCYRTLDSGLRERIAYALWVSGGFEVIRQALKDNVEPDFGYLQDKTGDIYAGLLELLMPKTPDDVAAEIAGSMKVAPAKPEKSQAGKRPTLDEPKTLPTIHDIDGEAMPMAAAETPAEDAADDTRFELPGEAVQARDETSEDTTMDEVNCSSGTSDTTEIVAASPAEDVSVETKEVAELPVVATESTTTEEGGVMQSDNTGVSSETEPVTRKPEVQEEAEVQA